MPPEVAPKAAKRGGERRSGATFLSPKALGAAADVAMARAHTRWLEPTLADPSQCSGASRGLTEPPVAPGVHSVASMMTRATDRFFCVLCFFSLAAACGPGRSAHPPPTRSSLSEGSATAVPPDRTEAAPHRAERSSQADRSGARPTAREAPEVEVGGATHADPGASAEARPPTADRPPRVLEVERGVAYLEGEPPPGAPPLPPGYRRPTRDLPEPPSEAYVWWLVPADASGPICERWRWLRRGSGAVLERRDGRRLRVEVDASRWTLYPTGSGASSRVRVLQPVAAEADRWVLVATTRPIAAYHEDDVEVWYRSAEACEEARRIATRSPEGL